MRTNQDGSAQFCRRTRREMLWESGAGFGGVALTGMLSGSDYFHPNALASDNLSGLKSPDPMAPKPAHHEPKAKAVIFLFMYGGPSHMDTFDYKPALYPLDGKTIDVKTFGRGGHKKGGRVVGPKWGFKSYGESGKMVSDLFPNLGTCVDDMAFVHSMYAESPIHGSAMLMMNSGKLLSGSPAMGSWVNYGLGSENENMPGFVVMLDQKGGPISGAKNWSSGYMPAAFQGTVIKADSNPILDLKPAEGVTDPVQRAVLKHLREKNMEHLAERPTIPNWRPGSRAMNLLTRCRAPHLRPWILTRNRMRPSRSMGSTTREQPTSGASACWHADWSNAV